MRRVLFLLAFCSIVMIAASERVSGQDNFSLRVHFSDSLEAEAGTHFIYAQISVKNIGASTRDIQLFLRPPSGWRLMGQVIIPIMVKPDSTQHVPVTLLRQRDASASWEPLTLQFSDSIGNLMLDTFLLIKAPVITDFSVLALRQDFELEVGMNQLKIPLQFYNKGSTKGVYSVSIRNSSIDFKQANFLTLGPGRDTSLLLPIKWPSSLTKTDDRVVLQFTDSIGNSRSLPIAINRVYRSLKLHPSRYKTFPISVEAGSFLVDRHFYYYVEATSSLLVKDGVLDIAYRTKTFGPFRTVERNILTANLRTSRFDISLGHLSQIKHFYAYGTGLRIAVKNKRGNILGLEGITPVRNSVQTNNYFSVHWQHLSKKITWWHQLAVDLDKRKGINGYLLFHEALLRSTSNRLLKVNLSAGWEEFTKISVFSNNDLGIGMGYTFQGQQKNWDWQSTWQYHQKSYPGVNKGARTVFQMLRWKTRKHSFEISYQYNSTTSSILQDTIYIADAFFFNMEKSGVKWAIGNEKMMLSVGTGFFRQTGLSAGQLPRYQFGELAFSTRFSEKSKLSLSSFTGYANNSMVDQAVWLTNTSIDWQLNRVGVRGFYVQQPLLKDSILKYLIHYNQTLLISPYVNFRFFQRLTGSLRYSISRSLYDNRTTTSCGFNMLYRSKKDNWQITANGAIPITRSRAPGTTGFSFPYLTISVKKKLQLPAIFKRRYYNLKVIAFEDLNLNGLPDSNERKLPDCRIGINGKQYLTDQKGSILISNTDTGNYAIQIHSTISNRGLFTLDRNLLIPFHSNREVFIPFRQGRAVYGKVIIDLDPYSGIKITPENILIRITDLQGKETVALTDSTGNFSLPLPSGKYTVSLNPSAFTGSVKPEQLSFVIDLISNSEQEVNFKLIQRRRPIRMRQL